MKEFHIYKDIRQRTNGEIYLGVVGPVRTGKSTFIRRFMEEMVIPHMEDGPAKTRSKDELPQAASGKNIMTTEPKFIPTEAAKIFLEDKTEMKIRLIDCVGFLIPGAFGATEEEKERLVHTPWFDYDIPFSQAAELGTRKVIEEHSTVGIVVTTDGSVTGIERAAYEEAEKKTIEELKKHQKPFVVVLNTKTPYTLAVKQLTKKLQEMYKVTVVPMDCASMDLEDISQLMKKILFEFPVCQVDFETPGWFDVLELSSPVKKAVIEFAQKVMNQISCMRDAKVPEKENLPQQISRFVLEETNLAQGKIVYEISLKEELYFSLASECAGFLLTSQKQLFDALAEYARLRSQYQKVQSAMESVAQKGYGVVTPERKQINISEPIVVRHGSRYGVRMKATAPSIHMIQSMVETEIAPIVGSEQQAKDLVDYIESAAQKEQEQEARSIAEAELQKALSEAQSRDESIAASEAESREQAQKEAEEASIAQEKAEQEAREEQERQAQGAGLAERLAGYETVSRPAGSTGDIICIDPGHQSRGNNGKEPEGPGSQTMKTKVAGGTGGVVSGVPEYQLTLTIGMMLKTELQNRGYTVVMTRESNDVDISNKERADIATAAGAAATIRIHADGVDSASASGASVLVPGSSNPYIQELAGSSSQLGSCIINSYCAATGMKNRGVVGSDNMTGINWSTNPVALLELGFMTNPTDDANMQDDTYQQLMVRGIADGIDAYFGR